MAAKSGPSVEGFQASLILSGQRSITDKSPSDPTGHELQQIAALWNALLVAQGLQLRVFFERRFRLAMRKYSCNEDMRNTLKRLEVHSLGLQEFISPGITPEELLKEIPDLSEQTRALLKSPPYTPYGPLEAKVQALATWFKKNYFKWIDPIACPTCGGETGGIGGSPPTPTEQEDGAGRVELHKCKKEGCSGLRRFCRYGKVKALVRQREGRCGEFAHLFYAFLRALDIEARYILNTEDHVWAEYWSPELKHWVHVDPCEETINKPLLYERGWGKKQAFCLAFGPYGAEDVSRAYIDDWKACEERRRAKGWSEIALKTSLLEHTIRLRKSMSGEEVKRLAEMDKLQQAWIDDERIRFAEAERDDLKGRDSGTEEWKAARDELGPQ